MKHLMVVVNREQGGKENLEKLGFQVHALAKISDIVHALARCQRSISKAQANAVLSTSKSKLSLSLCSLRMASRIFRAACSDVYCTVFTVTSG